MWFYKEDNTKPIINAKEHIHSQHRNKTGEIQLPKTAVLLYMRGIEYIMDSFEVELITNNFPRFLNSCPIYKIRGRHDICFLDGGRGAPQAVDTIETLKAYGVKNIITAGLIGGFSEKLTIGDIVIPSYAYSEEGTSLHYYETLNYAKASNDLYANVTSCFTDYKDYPIVTTDSVYRQTFYKEALWREKGAVGVDMETSALFSVGEYLKLNVVCVLLVSDLHPFAESDQPWKWHMSSELRKELLFKVIQSALSIDIE